MLAFERTMVVAVSLRSVELGTQTPFELIEVRGEEVFDGVEEGVCDGVSSGTFEALQADGFVDEVADEGGLADACGSYPRLDVFVVRDVKA